MSLSMWNGTYAGKECVLRKVTAESGEEVNTVDGVVHARRGDYVAQDLVKAPRGYRSRHIEKVIRHNDNRLVNLSEIESESVEDVPEPDYLEDDDA